MDYTSDSDISEDTRNLVSQGLAGVKRMRLSTASQTGRIRERLSIPNMDTSNVRSPFWREATIGDTLTHGLVSTEGEISNGQNYNIGTAEVGSEVVAEPRSARAELSRRAGGRELSSEEMLIAYGELEREMNELRNYLGRKTNPSDTEALSSWRERVEITRRTRNRSRTN